MGCIESYGLYVPETRLPMDKLAAFYGVPDKTRVESMAVPNLDEDVVTMGFEAAKMALRLGGVNPQEIGALLWGSVSPPFQKKSVGVLLSQSLNLHPHIITLDFGSSTKLVGEALITADCLIEADRVEKALIICSDFIPQDGRGALDLPSSAGAAALVVSKNGFAKMNHFGHYQSEVYDFWQLSGETLCRYEPEAYGASYEKAIMKSLECLFSKDGMAFEKISRAAIHLPFVKGGAGLLKKLEKSRFAEDAAEDALRVVKKLGNLYAPSLLFGLFHALEKSSPGDLIAAVSYGSGSSDAVLLEMVDEMAESFKNPSILTRVLERDQAINMARFQELNRS